MRGPYRSWEAGRGRIVGPARRSGEGEEATAGQGWGSGSPGPPAGAGTAGGRQRTGETWHRWGGHSWHRPQGLNGSQPHRQRERACGSWLVWQAPNLEAPVPALKGFQPRGEDKG